MRTQMEREEAAWHALGISLLGMFASLVLACVLSLLMGLFQ